MTRKTKLQLEAEKLKRTRNFKVIKTMLNSFDPDTVKLGIGIIEGKKRYPTLVKLLKEELAWEEDYLVTYNSESRQEGVRVFDTMSDVEVKRILADKSIYKKDI